MTTTVKVEAHCSFDKKVEVTIINEMTDEVYEEFSLEDGESASRVVYDTRVIYVTEVLK